MKIGDERGRAIDQEPVHNKEFASDGCRGEIEIEGRIQSHNGRSSVMGTLMTHRPSFFNRVATLAFAAADAQRASQSSPSAGHPRTPTHARIPLELPPRIEALAALYKPVCIAPCLRNCRAGKQALVATHTHAALAHQCDPTPSTRLSIINLLKLGRESVCVRRACVLCCHQTSIIAIMGALLGADAAAAPEGF